jgi:serine/threonine protein kinase
MLASTLLHYQNIQPFRQQGPYEFFVAHNRHLAQKVLIQTLHASYRENLGERQRLKKQAQKMAAFTHPLFPRVIDILESDEQLLVIQEFAEGLPLDEYLRGQALPEQKAKRLFSQIVDVLTYAHQRQLLHPYLHPSQILITKEENIKIIGWQDGTSASQKPEIYHSPEYLKEQRLSAEGNIFSLGMIYFLMLTGKYPFEGSNPEQYAEKIQKEKLPPASTFYPAVFEHSQYILDKACARRSSERFESCQALQEALFSSLQVGSNEVPKDAFTQLPLVGLGIMAFLLIAALLVANRDSSVPNRIAFDLSDTAGLQKRKDSVKRQRYERFLRDSLRIAQSKAQDTMKVYVHKVQRGDNIQGIAKRYNMSLAHFKRMNNIENNDELRAGSGVRVVVRAVHKVLHDENLHSIAKKYDITYYDLLRTNAITDEEEEVFEGKELIIPFK